MATPYDLIIENFLLKMEQDIDFFEYHDCSKEESLQIAIDRSINYMKNTLSILKLKLDTNVDLTMDDSYQEIVGDIDDVLMNLITDGMYVIHLKSGANKIKQQEVQYTPKDLQVFSPANDRKTYLSMYNDIREELYSLIDTYNAREKNTETNIYGHKIIDYQSYDDDFV